MTTDTAQLRELLLLMNRERMMLADLSWYWDEGMPATSKYLESVFNIHDAAPALLDELDRLRAELAESRKANHTALAIAYQCGFEANEHRSKSND